MRVTVQGLRRWIVIAAVLLMAVVVGFFLYGRYRFRRFERDLPARLGVNIQQTANGFSYTQSSQGHPLFTLKASKELQLRSGHVLLHNVDITLYGPPGSGRADRIFGSDFDYDQSHGVATSQGDVTIEMQGEGQSNANAPGNNTIRVRTRGLVFVQSTGEATTQQPVEFELPRAGGTSVGADYNSKTGVVVLNSQVRITTSSDGKPVVIEATQATLRRASMQGFLVGPTMQYETESGRADNATVWFRKDGTTQRVDAVGRVRMQTDTGSTVDAASARFLLDAKSQPTQADLGGGVQFASAAENENMHGSAHDGTLLFAEFPGPRGGSQTVLRHAEFRSDVTFQDETTEARNGARSQTEKDLQGQKVDVEFGPPIPGHEPQAHKATADGNPVLTTKQTPARGPGQTTLIRGDHLVATLGEDNALQVLDGNGHTQIVQSATDGSHNTSRGDTLHATFERTAAPVRGGSSSAPKPAASGDTPPATQTKHKKGNAGPPMQTVLERAIQDGNVILTETPARKPGSTTEPATLTGWAEHADYSAADELLHLTGSPRITDSQTMQMAAEAIDYHRNTQDAAATGNVKATYIQQPAADASPTASPAPAAPPTLGGSGPVHVIAARARMLHATNESFFYGTPQAPARMWQDTDSLLAPVIEIDRTHNLLRAHAEDKTTEPIVSANFTSAMGANHQQSVVRVHSQTLVYSDRDRRADFHGSVTAEQGDGVVHSDDALIFLKPAPEKTKPETAKPVKAATPVSVASGSAEHPPHIEGSSQSQPAGAATSGSGKPNSAAGNRNSQLDHMIATGHVVLDQPGRRGEGEKLVYTADDGVYRITGTPALPPKLWDQTRGTTTGSELVFNTQDNTVQVIGGKSSAVTDTQAPK